MTVPFTGAIVFTIFFILSVVTFNSLLNSWNIHASEFSVVQDRQVNRINTSLSISSAGPTETDLDCNNFTATVVNTGSVDIVPVDDGDVMVEYTDTAGAKVSSYLDYATTAVTGNRWTVTSISPATRDPNLWNPQETATFKYSIASSMKADAYGPLLVNSPIGVGDMEYFQCPEYLYLHSETNNIAGTDYYKLISDVSAEVTAAATTISAVFSAGTTGRIRPASNNGKSTFLLTETDTIPASTWTMAYRVKRDKEDQDMVVHADIDVVIRDAIGSVRATLLATEEVAASSNITSTSWQTFTATFSFSEYTVVDSTDYLEIDLFAHATTNTSVDSISVDFRLDDNTLSAADQTRLALR